METRSKTKEQMRNILYKAKTTPNVLECEKINNEGNFYFAVRLLVGHNLLKEEVIGIGAKRKKLYVIPPETKGLKTKRKVRNEIFQLIIKNISEAPLGRLKDKFFLQDFNIPKIYLQMLINAGVIRRKYDRGGLVYFMNKNFKENLENLDEIDFI